MSSNITKYGIRVKLNALNGKSNEEIKEYFLEKGFHIHPGMEDEDIPYFLEGCDLLRHIDKTYPIKGYKEGWGVEHLFYVAKDENEKGENIRSMEDIYEESRNLVTEYDCDIEDIKVFAYTYHNGTDEPVFF